MIQPWSRLSGLCLAVLLLAGTVWATDATTEADPGTGSAPAAPGQTDLGDLWHELRHQDVTEADPRKRFLVVAPTIGSKPSTGLNGGLAGNVAFFLGDPASTSLSSFSGSFKVSEKKQTLGNVKFAAFTSNDRWLLQGDDRLWWTSQDSYGLGGDTPSAGAQNVKYDLYRFFQTAYRNIKPGLYVGAGLNVSDHTDVQPGSGALPTGDQSSYAAYSLKHGFALDRQVSGGTSVGLVFDTRDNQINAVRGMLASATYRTFFDGFVGGDSTWQELYLDARTYRKLTKDARHRLAFWFVGDLVTGGTAPYFDLPSTGAQERSARGYAEGRYRGEHLLYGEMEYRGALTRNGLVGVVAFLNTTTVDNVEAGEKLFESFAPGGGFGFRFQLDKRSRTNLCTDYGWGKAGSRGFYLFIQEAF